MESSFNFSQFHIQQLVIVAVPLVYLTMLSVTVGYPGGLSEQTQPTTH